MLLLLLCRPRQHNQAAKLTGKSADLTLYVHTFMKIL
jgi:hypothetical protein